MMIDSRLDFGGSPSANIGPSWFGQVFRPIKRLPGQLLGLGGLGVITIPDEIRTAAAACSGGDATACATYYAWYNAHVSGGSGSGSCPPAPSGLPSTDIMSSPSCSGDQTCVNLAAAIERYNLAVIHNAQAAWDREVCESNKCRNNGGPEWDCNGKSPMVEVPAQPTYPGARMLRWSNGFVSGYAGTGSGGGSGGSGGSSGSGVTPAPSQALNDAQEASAAKQSLTNAMATLGVGGNQAIQARLESEFPKGLAWWLSSHSSYAGLSSYTAANAESTVRQWIRDLGVAPPPSVTGSDGTPKVPSFTGSNQGGNVTTPVTGGKDPLVAGFGLPAEIGGFPIGLVAIAGIAALLLMRGGR